MLQKLADLYQDWIVENDLPYLEANELIVGDYSLTEDQTIWLNDFIKMWEQEEDAEVYASELAG